MEPIVVPPGEGERLDAEHTILLSLPQIDVLEFTVGPDYEGPGPHFHEHHVDSFVVLEGELEFTAGENTLRAGPGTSVSVSPRVVHSFTNPGPAGARFINAHTPGGFADYMRASFRGDDPDPTDFDIHDVDAPGGPGSAVVTPPGGGERFQRPGSTITIRTDRPELGLLELEVEPTWAGVALHSHDDHVDTFFVLAGEAVFLRQGEPVRATPRTLVSAPIGVVHGIGRVDAPARFVNLHAPGGGFAEGVRRSARRRAG